MTRKAATSPPTRPRRRLRRVEVVGLRPLTDRLVSITFTGEFDGFEISAPTQHIKVLIPRDGEHAVQVPAPGPDGLSWPADQPRPRMRTYTPRHFDPDTGVLEVQFVIHGEGPASAWAERAAPGDRLAIGGPGGRMPLELGNGPWVIGGDESAIPAIGTLLDALPLHVTAEVYIEADENAHKLDLGPRTGQVQWLRQPNHDHPGSQLHDALTTASITPESSVWIACEATAVRQIRRSVLSTGQVEPARLVTRGYWRLGQADHPDHDYGDDT
jgi:NADPH-dependent ferric siderophore reductase